MTERVELDKSAVLSMTRDNDLVTDLRKKKICEAWAFLAVGDGPYFIENDDPQQEQKIYLERPKDRKNPFDYSNEGYKWKPTKIIIYEA